MTERIVGAQGLSQGPVLLVLLSALMWGLWWVPVRLCESLGLTGVWPNLGINLGTLIILAVAVLFTRGKGRLSKRALLGSLSIGLAVALYGAALSLTEVARAVLLFYLAPAWSTAIEVTFLRQRWHWRRFPALILSFTGMIVVLRGEVSFEGGGIGDLAALVSGMAWSVGTALVFSKQPQSRSRMALAVMTAAVLVSVLLLPLDWQGLPSLHSADVGLAVMIALVAGGVYLTPIIVITLWGAERLLPATISFLLTAEILSGIVSSAIFLDERFGWPEAVGTMLIITSVVAHVLLSDRSRSEG